MRYKNLCAAAALFLLAMTSAFVQEKSSLPAGAGGGAGFSIEVLPDLYIPIGEDTEYFGLGYGSSLSMTWRPAQAPFLFVGLGALYSWLPTQAPGLSLSSGAVAARLGFRFQLGRSFSISVDGGGGWFAAAQNGASGDPASNPYWDAGLALDLELSRTFALDAGAVWRSWYGLASGLGINAGVRLKLGGGGGAQAARLPADFTPIANAGRGLAFAGIRLDTVFPIFYKHYDDHPIGRVIVHNFETAAATDIKAWVNVKRYMDEAKNAGVPLRVRPGSNGELVLYGLFTDSLLEVVEATKLPISIGIEYTQFGVTYRDEFVATLDVVDRNAITWDDDRKVAAFISSKDPDALAWAKAVSAAVKDNLNWALSSNFQAAMAIHETLRIMKFAYVKDPTSALETNSKQVVDYVQFPRQTLGFRSGKCSDLTVLYCSLLESVGVPTALITTPGHILMAIDLEMDPSDIPRVFSRPDDIIVRDGKAWLPIETTDRTGDFVTAWRTAAREWREASAKKVAGFVSVRDAWREYQPVAYAGPAKMAPQPDAKATASAFKASLAAFISGELGPRIASLQAELKGKGGSPALYNRLGVLYARFGQSEKAEEQFLAAIAAGKDNQAALFNMGNILYVRGKYSDAIAYYSRVLKASPNHPQALLSLSRTSAALGKYSDALSFYERLKKADAALASQYAWLANPQGDGTRAADAAGQKGEVTWQD